jgi:hypothetical protein
MVNAVTFHDPRPGFNNIRNPVFIYEAAGVVGAVCPKAGTV